jgi:uncharacterized protein (DUF885 family)
LSGTTATSFASRALDEFWRLNPVDATRAGVRTHDALAPDLSPDGFAARRAWRIQTAADLQRLEDDLDRRVLRGALVGFEVLEDWRWEHRAPQIYLEQALNGLQLLLERPDPDAAPGEREAALQSRLAAVPRLLDCARVNLKPDLVPPEFVEIALSAADGAQRFLASLPSAIAADGDQRVLAGIPSATAADGDQRFLQSTATAQRAVADFEQFLRRDLKAAGSFALGSDGFEHLLREQHGLDLTPDDVYDYGRELASSLTARLESTAREIDSSRTWHEQIEALKSNHPTRETLLHTYADEAARARAFVLDKDLVSIPPGEQFEVRPTAPFLRATTPLGHFSRTPPFSPTDNLGILYITPIDPSLTESRQQELLTAHCYTAIRAICLHETVPGHHLQLWHAKLRGTPLRRQFWSTLFAEGWGLYCEELMEEAGYYDSPGLRLWRLKNAMWRAVRLMVDVGLHCRGLSLEAAAQPLIDLGGLEPNTARGEALRYATSPTQPSSYVLGRDRIVELRRVAERGRNFSLRAFHDWLLGYGTVAPTLIPEP